jgi:hypothetical protein
MKKIAIASLIALAAATASAVEVGVTTTTDYSGVQDRQGFGVSVGQKVGAIGITGGFERFTKGSNDQDRYSVVAGYDVAKIGPVTVTPKLGVAYLNNQTNNDGYALTVGVGASVPVTKQVSVTLDVARQFGQDSVSTFDGNRATAGVKYSF